MLLGFWVRTHHGLLKLFLKRSWFCPICDCRAFVSQLFWVATIDFESFPVELEVQWQGFVHFSGHVCFYHAFTAHDMLSISRMPAVGCMSQDLAYHA